MDSLIDLSVQITRLKQTVESLLLQTTTKSFSTEQLRDMFDEITLNIKSWNKQLSGLVEEPTSEVIKAFDKVQESLPQLITVLVFQHLNK